MSFQYNGFWGPRYDLMGGGATSADPQLLYFENFPGINGAAFAAASHGTLSVHAVNIPLSISFNKVQILANVPSVADARTLTFRFGLYSLNAGTLSLANSASQTHTFNTAGTGTLWFSMVTSATQNITPGTWYFAFINNGTAGAGTQTASILVNSSINLANAAPGAFNVGRMTASTAAMPASIATSALDITGSDAIRQPYILITA